MHNVLIPTSTQPNFFFFSVNTLDSLVLTWSNAANRLHVIFAPAPSKVRVSYRSLTSLGNSKFKLKEPIIVVITETDDEVIAEFPEAEIAVSEDSVGQALAWLRRRIIGSYTRFKANYDKLGPVPARQLKVLEKYIAE